MSETRLYDRLGKREGIRTVVDDFYDRLEADEALGPFFEDADTEKLRRTQTDFLCEAAGGPETYDAEPVRAAHLHVPFTPADIHRAVDLLSESLAAFDVPEEDAQQVLPLTARESRPSREARVFRHLLSEPSAEQGGREARTLW